MDVWYCDHYRVPLPEGHRFPMEKYAALRAYLVDEGILAPAQLRASPPAPLEAVTRVHDAGYVDAFLSGRIDAGAMKRVGFPWSRDLVRRSLASAGGTLAATTSALDGGGVSGTLSGGTHHARIDCGAGYCVFNDIAIATRHALARGRVERVLVVDLDVHQGDGTAHCLADEPRAFTLSIHGERNFPLRKVPSDLDIGLPDGTGDEDYLGALDSALNRAWERSRPELVFYQAGVDPLAEDKLGRLALSHAGLRRRDELVLSRAIGEGVPLVLTLGGGYADPIEASVRASAETYRVARQLLASRADSA